MTDGLILTNNAGVALSNGGPGDGNGFAVQLGYYSTATTGNNFSGTWIPLTGQNSLNTAYATSSIGDGDQPPDFVPNGELYQTYNFSSTLSNTFNSLPDVGTFPPLSLRFYNATLISNTTLYNTVSNDSWLWKTPATPFPNTVFMYLSDAGLEWQDASNPFKTTIPEPASALLLAAGAAGLLGRRRRRS